MVGKESFPKSASRCPGVQTHSFVTFGTLLRLFEEASLYAMPALCEPWGLVYLEALASGTPVLGLPRLGLLDITRQGQHGFLVPEPSAEAIAHSLLATHADRDELRRKGLAGREFVRENFTWEKTAREMLERMRPAHS
jgi:glycosyltransferase involved in cell wall biosynthesis